MGEFTVKCSLAAISAGSAVNETIERIVRTHHALALRGSLVATNTALKELKRGRIPDVFNQSWWNRCYNSCGSLRGKRNICTRDAQIESSILELFGHASEIISDHTWPFVNELALQSVIMTHNMIASNFHAQLAKAAQREIIIFESRNGKKLCKSLKHHICRNFVLALTTHRSESPYPIDTPSSLIVILRYLTTTWRERFQFEGAPIECPTESFIYNQNAVKGSAARKERSRQYLGVIYAWMHDLQEHRIVCIQRLQSLLPAQEGLSAEYVFGKAAKALAPLPVFSFNVLHMGISQDNGLSSLCKLAQIDVVKDFYSLFPGISKYDRKHKCHYIRTDGVTVSLTMKKEGTLVKRKRKRERAKEERDEDQAMLCLPQEGTRLVGIDPGRRDMIAAVSNENDKFKISTKGFRQDTGTKKSAEITNSLLKRTRVGQVSLYQALQTLPCRRDYTLWKSYLDQLLPLLDTIIKTYQVRRLRRRRFWIYKQRDKIIDKICHKITSKKTDVLVAFGNANTCHSGFGYAPAALGRLRHRLSRVHRVKVELIDEYNTSKFCHLCHGALKEIKVSHSVQKIQDSPSLQKKRDRHHFKRTPGGNYTEKPHGLRYCSSCRNPQGAPTFHHRDFNSANNILDIYISLARDQTRPLVFRRPQ